MTNWMVLTSARWVEGGKLCLRLSTKCSESMRMSTKTYSSCMSGVMLIGTVEGGLELGNLHYCIVFFDIVLYLLILYCII